MNDIELRSCTIDERQSEDLFAIKYSFTPCVPSHRGLSKSLKINRSFSALQGRVRASFYDLVIPMIYIMSADCGTGKTTKIQEVIRGWKKEGLKGREAIIFVATLEEIDIYISGSGLDKEDYAVCSPDEKYKSYGAGLHAINEVPVLFATHAKARKEMLKSGRFRSAKAFHYRGKPRGARIWDEGFHAAEGAALTLHQLMQLPRALKRYGKGYARFFDGLCQQMERRIGFALPIPLEITDVADALYGSKVKLSDDVRRTLTELVKLAGCTAFVTDIDDTGDCRLIGKGRSLPADIAPLFVLDASARLTERYNQLPAHGMDVAHLDPAAVDYDRLAIHWYDKGVGKTAMSDKKQRSGIFGIIAELANSKLSEAFLIVMKKEFCGPVVNERVTLPDELAKLITDPERVRITNWGRHHGTNQFRDIGNVVIVSDHRYPNEAYDALALAASGTEFGCVSAEQRRTALDEEFMHNIYQAVCRSNVRQREGGRSGSANAYFIMPDSQRQRGLVSRAFPGCSIRSWIPVCPRKETKLMMALRVLLNLMEARRTVSKKELAKACGDDDARYLTKVYRDERFKADLSNAGIRMGHNYFSRFSTSALTA